jgi:hypothetical protein
MTCRLIALVLLAPTLFQPPTAAAKRAYTLIARMIDEEASWDEREVQGRGRTGQAEARGGHAKVAKHAA